MMALDGCLFKTERFWKLPVMHVQSVIFAWRVWKERAEFAYFGDRIGDYVTEKVQISARKGFRLMDNQI